MKHFLGSTYFTTAVVLGGTDECCALKTLRHWSKQRIVDWLVAFNNSKLGSIHFIPVPMKKSNKK